MRELPHTMSCFVCGEANPVGLRMRFHTDGRVVRAQFVPRREHIGFRNTVHGGLISTLLDEAMVWACAVVTKHFSFCAELSVRYLAPVRPEQEFVIIGELVENRREKLYLARAELQDGERRVLAAGSGKYLPIKDVAVEDMASDFVGDARSFFGLGPTQ